MLHAGSPGICPLPASILLSLLLEGNGGTLQSHSRETDCPLQIPVCCLCCIASRRASRWPQVCGPSQQHSCSCPSQNQGLCSLFNHPLGWFCTPARASTVRRTRLGLQPPAHVFKWYHVGLGGSIGCYRPPWDVVGARCFCVWLGFEN